MALFLALLVATGCQRPPEPTADDMIAYARNAAVGAKVRHLGPTVQPYVERVFKAYNAWHEAFSPVAQLVNAKALWPVDSPKWRDARAVDAQLKTLGDWLGKQSQRKEFHEQLLKAIDAVPAAYQADASRIREQVTTILDATRPKRIDTVVRLYESLLSLVADASARFDPDKPGLAFRDPQATAKAHQVWNQLHAILAEVRKDELDRSDWVLTSGKKSRAAAIQRKQNIDRFGANRQQALREIRTLDIDILYYDKIIDEAERQKRQLAG